MTPPAVDGDPAPVNTTGAALALLAVAMAGTGQLLVLRDRALRLGSLDFLVGGACMIALVGGGHGRIEAVLPASAAERETEPGRSGWLRAMGHLLREPFALAMALARAAPRSPLRSAAVALALTLALSIYAILVLRQDAPVSYWDVFGLWLASIGLYVAAFGRAERWVRPSRWREAVRAHRDAVVDAAALLGLALLLRVPLLGAWPDVISGDEGMIGDIARDLGVAAVGNVFGSAWAHGNLYYYLVSVPYALIADPVAAIRLPSALGGALAIPATYLAARQLFGRRVGLLAGFLLATFHMHVHVSRIAFCHGCDSLVASVAMLGLARGLARRDLGWAAVAGVALGLAQYGYVGGRLIDVVAVAYVVLLAANDPAYVRARLGVLGVAVGAALVTAAPIFYWAIYRTGDYMARVGSVGLVQRLDQQGQPPPGWATAATQVRDTFMAVVAYPADFFYNARLPLLDGASSVLFVLGLALVVWRWRDRRLLLPGLHVLGGLAMLALSIEPNLTVYRIAGTLSSYAILIAVVLVALVEGGLGGLGASARALAAIPAVAVLAIGAYNVNYYFRDHLPNCRYTDARTAAASVVATFVRDRVDRADTVFVTTGPDLALMPYLSVPFLTDREPRNLADLPDDTPLPGERGSAAYIYLLPEGTIDLATAIGDARPAWVVAGASEVGKLEGVGGDMGDAAGDVGDDVGVAGDADGAGGETAGGERVVLERCGKVVGEAVRMR